MHIRLPQISQITNFCQWCDKSFWLQDEINSHEKTVQCTQEQGSHQLSLSDIFHCFQVQESINMCHSVGHMLRTVSGSSSLTAQSFLERLQNRDGELHSKLFSLMANIRGTKEYYNKLGMDIRCMICWEPRSTDGKSSIDWEFSTLSFEIQCKIHKCWDIFKILWNSVLLLILV